MTKKVKLGPADLADGELRSYEVGTQSVLVTLVKGRYRAMDDWCNHAGCLLSGGRIEENLVICPCHEVGFDLDTGKNVTSPGVCDDQSIVPLTVEEGELFIENG